MLGTFDLERENRRKKVGKQPKYKRRKKEIINKSSKI